ncbi:MAG: RNase H-like domain-containing protein [Myxococcota bacterium]
MRDSIVRTDRGLRDAVATRSDFVREWKRRHASPLFRVHRLRVHGFEVTTGLLDDQEAELMQELLNEFSDVFADKPASPRVTPLIMHRINTGDSIPSFQRAYRVSPDKERVMHDQCISMANNGVIAPLQYSAWAAPALLIPKADGTAKLGGDYRNLNQRTVTDHHPMPRVDDCLHAIGNHLFRSSLDLCAGYWAIGVHPDDRHKCAFITPRGLWTWLRMPYGLKNAPSTFCRLMDYVFAGFGSNWLTYYVDDLCVSSDSFAQHLEHLRLLFTRLRQANLTLKASKCTFATDSIQFLGFTVGADGITPSLKKTHAVRAMTRPSSVKLTQAFLGICSYYRQHIHRFATIAAPLYELTVTGVDFVWTQRHQNAFDTLKQALVSMPVVRHPDWDAKFVLQCDASDVGISAVLSQCTDDGSDYVCAYASRRLRPNECKWPIHEREGLAVLFGLQKFRHYLVRAPFTVQTDNAAVKHILQPRSTGRLARWAMAMSEFAFDVQHRPGVSNANADALSRMPVDTAVALVTNSAITSVPGEVPAASVPVSTSASAAASASSSQQEERVTTFFNANSREIAAAQRNHEPYAKMIAYLTDRDSVSTEVRADVSRYARRFFLRDGALFRIGTSTDYSWYQLAVPPQYRRQILELCHSSPLAGHGGRFKTWKILQSRFYWENSYKDCKRFVDACLPCRLAKTTRPRRAGLFQQPQLFGPFVSVHIDLVGPLSRTHNGAFYIFSAIDPFTGFVELLPLPNIKADTVAQAFWDAIITRHAIPRYVHSDRGSQFMSKLFRSLNRRLGVQQTFTTAYHPQGNGRCERTHRRLGVLLRIFSEEKEKTWDQHLQTVAFAIRTAVADGHEHSPFEYLYGRPPTLPVDIAFNAEPGHLTQGVLEFHRAHLNQLSKLQDILRTTVEEQRLRRRMATDPKRKHVDYKLGTPVLLFTPTRIPGVASKLVNQWSGPHTITGRVSDVSYEIRKKKTNKTQVVHVQRLAIYVPFDKSADAQVPILNVDDEKSSMPANANVVAVDMPANDLVPDDLVVLYDVDVATYYVAQFLFVHPDNDNDIVVHYFNSYGAVKKAAHRARSYAKAWVDPKDGQQVFTNSPKAAYEPYTAIVDRSSVITSGFTLTAAGRLPINVLRRIAAHPGIKIYL